jgi:hypothetical protein
MLDSYGKRGISLSLFRKRYKRPAIQKAKSVALGTVQSEQTDKPEIDAVGYGSAVKVESNDSENENQREEDFLHVKDPKKQQLGASVLRAIRDCEKEIRETKCDKLRQELTDYLRELRKKESGG